MLEHEQDRALWSWLGIKGPALFWTRSFGHAQFCDVPQGTPQGWGPFFHPVLHLLKLPSFCLPSSTLSQLLHYVSSRIRYLQSVKVCKYTLAGLPHDDWRISRKAESLFVWQLAQILLVKSEDRLHPISSYLLGEIAWPFPSFVSCTGKERRGHRHFIWGW